MEWARQRLGGLSAVLSAAREPEWSVFEPVLLPVLDAGPGALGSMWETEAIVSVEPWFLVDASAPATIDQGVPPNSSIQTSRSVDCGLWPSCRSSVTTCPR